VLADRVEERPPVALFLPKGIWGTLVDKLPGGSSAEVKP
jgi:hypothetical protein